MNPESKDTLKRALASADETTAAFQALGAACVWAAAVLLEDGQTAGERARRGLVCDDEKENLKLFIAALATFTAQTREGTHGPGLLLRLDQARQRLSEAQATFQGLAADIVTLTQTEAAQRERMQEAQQLIEQREKLQRLRCLAIDIETLRADRDEVADGLRMLQEVAAAEADLSATAARFASLASDRLEALEAETRQAVTEAKQRADALALVSREVDAAQQEVQQWTGEVASADERYAALIRERESLLAPRRLHDSPRRGRRRAALPR